MRSNPCMPCLLLLAGNPGPRPSRLKNPEEVALLGTTLEIEVVRDSDGETEVHRFQGDGPNLYWSPSLKTLLIFPGKHVRWVGHIGPGPRPDERPTAEAWAEDLFKSAGNEKSAKLFRRWAQREAVDLGQLKIQDYPMRPVGRAKHIVYRSDKWHKGRTDDYIHKFGPKVRMAVSPGAKGKPPKAIAISGGRLTVTERGLVY